MASVRERMSMRCITERQSPRMQRDAFNQPTFSETSPLTNHPCYWQSQSARFVAQDKLAAVSTHLILLPLDSDIREQDIITAITDRRGRSIHDKRLRVTAMVPRENHIECIAEEYS